MQLPNYPTLHSQVLPIITEASEIFIKYYQQGVELKAEKSGAHLSTSVVSIADKELEFFIQQRLKEAFPEFGFIGEESVPQDLKEYNWILDPIDGTMNFGSGIPLCGISLALWSHQEAHYAIVALPMLSEVVSAGKGAGIYLNGNQFEKSAYTTDKTTLLYSHIDSDQTKIQLLSHIVAQDLPLPRYLASTVYSGAAVALRKVYGMICINNGLWDVAAISLLCSEAGLTTIWLSKKPDFTNLKSLKEYSFSVIFGEGELALKTSAIVKKKL